MNCQFCLKEVKNNNSKAQHELYCDKNPNKKLKVPSYGMLGKSGSNQYIKGTAKPLSEETRKLLSDKAKNKIWDDESRKRHSIVMKKAVADYPESYSSSNRGRTKQITYNGVKFQGKWELAFYLFCVTNNIAIVRSTEWFLYEWNGTRKYFPDFYLPEQDLYIEIKGYETERDRAKWSHFPKKLLIIRKTDIANIRKGIYKL